METGNSNEEHTPCSVTSNESTMAERPSRTDLRRLNEKTEWNKIELSRTTRLYKIRLGLTDQIYKIRLSLTNQIYKIRLV